MNSQQSTVNSGVRILGRYTADDLQRAMRVVLVRADLRALRARRLEGAVPPAPRTSFDVRPDGRLIAV